MCLCVCVCVYKTLLTKLYLFNAKNKYEYQMSIFFGKNFISFIRELNL